MGRTYKRDRDLEDFDDPAVIDDMEDDDDSLEWMTRPNEARPASAGRRGYRPATGRAAYRSLPDDWQDFDYGGDDALWR